MNKNIMLCIFLLSTAGQAAFALPVAAAAGLPGASVTGGESAADGQRAGADNRHEPAAEQRARREQWCKDNADKCREVKARAALRREQCKADPAQCRAEIKARQEKRFKRADADGNGAISRAEAAKTLPGLSKHFDQIDANKDGQITPDEIDAARKARADARGARVK